MDQKYHGMEMPGKMKLGVSGCPNQCAETSFKDIGLVGTRKGWRIFVGGNGGTRARIATMVAMDLSTADAMDLVDRIVEYFKANAKPRERMGKMMDRLGLEHMELALGL